MYLPYLRPGGCTVAGIKRRARRAAPGKIRIIGGRLRGSVLEVPDRPGLRPTPNRLRETLFNWLQPSLAGAACLDLFAGSGALGVEALSRGAGRVQLVERDAGLAAALRANLQRLDRERTTGVHAGDACVFLDAAAPVPFDIAKPFDVIFVDPPFAAHLWEPVIARLQTGNWLAPRAWIYLEMPAGMHVTVPSTWHVEREKDVGDVHAMLCRRQLGTR